MQLEKTTHLGEWEKGKYYAAGETFTYKTVQFYVTEDHSADDDTHPRAYLTNERKDFPYKQVSKEN